MYLQASHMFMLVYMFLIRNGSGGLRVVGSESITPSSILNINGVQSSSITDEAPKTNTSRTYLSGSESSVYRTYKYDVLSISTMIHSLYASESNIPSSFIASVEQSPSIADEARTSRIYLSGSESSVYYIDKYDIRSISTMIHSLYASVSNISSGLITTTDLNYTRSSLMPKQLSSAINVDSLLSKTGSREESSLLMSNTITKHQFNETIITSDPILKKISDSKCIGSPSRTIINPSHFTQNVPFTNYSSYVSLATTTNVVGSSDMNNSVSLLQRTEISSLIPRLITNTSTGNIDHFATPTTALPEIRTTDQLLTAASSLQALALSTYSSTLLTSSKSTVSVHMSSPNTNSGVNNHDVSVMQSYVILKCYKCTGSQSVCGKERTSGDTTEICLQNDRYMCYYTSEKMDNGTIYKRGCISQNECSRPNINEIYCKSTGERHQCQLCCDTGSTCNSQAYGNGSYQIKSDVFILTFYCIIAMFSVENVI